MDPRIREHARTIINHPTSVETGDSAVVSAPSVAEDLVTAIHELFGDRDANVVATDTNPRFTRTFLHAGNGDYETPEHVLTLYEETDVIIRVRGETNTAKQSNVPPKTNAVYKRACKPTQGKMLSKRWCLTQYPVEENTQLVDINTEVYENSVYGVVTLDWDTQSEFQQQLIDILSNSDEVRIMSGDEINVTMSIAGNTAISDTTEHSLSDGEVFTAPVRNSMNGGVHFDLPLYRQGRGVSGIRVRFEDDKVVDYSAEGSEEILGGAFDTDKGARCLSGLGIGMNRGIGQFTYNILPDGKMGDTVHMTIDSAYPRTVGADNELSESAEHVDMIADMSEDLVAGVDGEVVQRDDTFVFEDGF